MLLKKIDKLIERLMLIIKTLDEVRDIHVHVHVDLSFYQQKATEFNLLLTKHRAMLQQWDDVNQDFQKEGELHQGLIQIEVMLKAKYDEALMRWCRDYKWLHRYMRGKERKSVL
jgi:hypothetical protein